MLISVSSGDHDYMQNNDVNFGKTGDEQAQEPPSSPEENGGFDGGGVMGVSTGSSAQDRRRKSQRRSADEPAESRVKAFWIMGRKWCPRNDDGGRMLEHFLELKLENERLKQELKVSLRAQIEDTWVSWSNLSCFRDCNLGPLEVKNHLVRLAR